jgi:hypothetical protein
MSPQDKFVIGFAIGFFAIPAMILIGIAIDGLHNKWKRRKNKED